MPGVARTCCKACRPSTATDAELARWLAHGHMPETWRARAVEILRLRYCADEPLSLRDLGERFGVSCERVRQVEARALRTLARAMHFGPAPVSLAPHGERLHHVLVCCEPTPKDECQWLRRVPVARGGGFAGYT